MLFWSMGHIYTSTYSALRCTPPVHRRWYLPYARRVKGGVVPTLADFPPALTVAQRLVDMGVFDRLPDECLVNEYPVHVDESGKRSAIGIPAHTDAKVWGDVVVTISIREDCEMRVISPSKEKHSIFFPAMAILIMSGEARHEWKHEIPGTLSYLGEGGESVKKSDDYRRVSISFRHLS